MSLPFPDFSHPSLKYRWQDWIIWRLFLEASPLLFSCRWCLSGYPAWGGQTNGHACESFLLPLLPPPGVLPSLCIFMRADPHRGRPTGVFWVSCSATPGPPYRERGFTSVLYHWGFHKIALCVCHLHLVQRAEPELAVWTPGFKCPLRKMGLRELSYSCTHATHHLGAPAKAQE